MSCGLTPIEEDKRERLRLSKPKVYEKVLKYEDNLAAGKSVAVMQIQYSYQCNMRCCHCSIAEFAKQDRRAMTPADIKSLCDQADAYGLAQIDFSGGEPVLFRDLDAVIEAIDPSRFYLMIDSNGWALTPAKLAHWKALGVDKVQIGLDSLNASEHDEFRHMPGAWLKATGALSMIRDAGLALQVATVITAERVHSQEFDDFLAFCQLEGAQVNAIWGKPAGEWGGRRDLAIGYPEIARFRKLAAKYSNLTPLHVDPHHGIEMGCIAAQKIVSITKYGDVMPCIWVYYSLGNLFDTPLADILDKGMRYFGGHHGMCRSSEDVEFMERYAEVTAGKRLPIAIEEAMGGIDGF